MDISVVIPSYRTEKTIEATLRAVQAQQTSAEVEVIVVDCSDNTLVQDICQKYAFVQFIHCEKRFNPGEGRNIGAQKASGKLLAFIDSDVLLDPVGLAGAWSFYQEGHPIFGGAISLKCDRDHYIPANLEHLYFNHESQVQRPVCRRSNLSSALMCVDRALFLANGGFKDIARMQDTEFTERLVAAGNELFFTPALLGFQKQTSKLKSVLRKIYITGQNLYFIRYSNSCGGLKKVMFFLALPFMALAKIGRIIYRQFRFNTASGRLKVLLFSPLLLVAGVAWMLGFYRAIILNEGIRSDR